MVEAKTATTETPPVPPAQETPPPSELDFEQLIAGIHKFYQRFRENELAYRQINDTIMGRREAVIQSMPTGRRDSDDRPITVALDYEALLKHLNVRDPQARAELLQQMLGPWNNYFVAEYAKSLRRLKEFVNQAYERLQSRMQ